MRKVLITGAPCSGKSTYLREHCGGNDIVYDWDELLSTVTGLPLRTEGTEPQRRVVNQLRYDIIRAAEKAQGIDTLWVISCKGAEDIKKALGEHEEVHIDVEEDEAKRRADEDPTRSDKEAEYEKIEKYFHEVEGPGEERTMSKATDNINKLANEKGVQYRSFEYQTRSDEENMYIEGRPVVFDTPTLLFNDGEYDIYEVIDRKAFDEADMSDVIFNVNHGGRVYARTRNNSLALEVDDEGLDMETSLWADDPGHMELYRDISRGNIDKMSFAFTVKKTTWTEDEENKTATRRVEAIDRLFDVSAVDIPAYDATSIAARNSVIAERENVISERAEAESRRLAEEKAESIRNEIKEIIGG